MFSHNEEDFSWDDVKVKLLLTLYLANIDEFRNTKNRKRDVWQRIANELECGVDACDKKFRNLKCYYVNLLRRNSATKSSWPYFRILHEIFENDPTLQINTKAEHSDESDCSDSDECEIRKGLKRSHTENLSGNDTGKLRKIVVNKSISSSLDKLIAEIDVANKIQNERNKLFQKYYSIISNNT